MGGASDGGGDEDTGGGGDSGGDPLAGGEGGLVDLLGGPAAPVVETLGVVVLPATLAALALAEESGADPFNALIAAAGRCRFVMGLMSREGF